MGDSAEPRSADIFARQLLEEDPAPESLARVLARLTERLASAEANAEALQSECVALHSDRDAARRALAEARDQAARATASLAAREKERARPRLALPDAADEHGSLRPDPRGVWTPAELIGKLRQFRTWAGNPSYREMARRSGRRAGASTMCTVLNSAELPDRLAVIDAIVEGCGGSDEDRQKFATAWRQLTMAHDAQAALPPGSPSPPRLRAVPVLEHIAGGDDETGYVQPITGYGRSQLPRALRGRPHLA